MRRTVVAGELRTRGGDRGGPPRGRPGVSPPGIPPAAGVATGRLPAPPAAPSVRSLLRARAVGAVTRGVLAGRWAGAGGRVAGGPVPPAEAGAGEQADAGDQDPPGGPDGMPRRFTLQAVTGLIERAGLRPGPGHGVRVFT